MASQPSPPAPAPAPAQAAGAIDSPDMRHAGRDLLSLALIDARNHTLRLLSRYEQALGSPALPLQPMEAIEPPRWLAGHIAWFAEWWIARNTQRAFGAECPVRPTRLAALEPQADGWWNPQLRAPAQRWANDLPDLGQTKTYLLEILETVLEMLDNAAPTDAGLYFYRLALFHEDLRAEQLVVMAQTLGLPLGIEPLPAAAAREPLLLPAARWRLGAAPTGFAFAQQSGALEVELPPFEIDAQPVSWQQFAEFVDDGGYDRSEFWSAEGWAWRESADRRAPRHVEQIGVAHGNSGGGVLRRRFGTVMRAAGVQAAVHLNWWEAEAWARWAGRRIATEVEWELAAHTAARRGFRWGEVHEWTAGTLRPWPGYRRDPWSAGGDFDPEPAFGQARVLRGASFATRARLRWPQWRGFALPGRDDGFFGFRTCAV